MFRARLHLSAILLLGISVLAGSGCEPQAKKQVNNNEAATDDKAFEIYGKTVSFQTLLKDEKEKFYKQELQRYQLIESIANQKYIEEFWKKKGEEYKTSPEEAMNQYMAKNAKYSEVEFNMTFQRYKDHANFKGMPKEQIEAQIRQFLASKAQREELGKITAEGLKKKELVVHYPKPKEPVYDVAINKDDEVRYGVGLDDIKPKAGGCEGDKCQITVVEYSEFQCPFCAKVLPTTDRLLKKYEGKIRWVVRQYPLDFHPRAKPAAIAAKCAGEQGKFWHMYTKLFANQRKLEDSDIAEYAKAIESEAKGQFDLTKYNSCIASPAHIEKVIASNLQDAQKVGISGTPAFLINGRLISGAVPYENFAKIFEEELAAN